jgi:hypothetical protein
MRGDHPAAVAAVAAVALLTLTVASNLALSENVSAQETTGSPAGNPATTPVAPAAVTFSTTMRSREFSAARFAAAPMRTWVASSM